MKEIYIVSAYPNTEYKQQLLVDLIDKLKSLQKEVLIASHYSIPKWIVDKVDYYIYDSKNLLDDSRTLDKYICDDYANTDAFRIEKLNPLHPIALLRIYQTAFNFVKNLGYEYFVFTEFDNVFTLDDLKKYDTIKKSLLDSSKKMFFFKLRPYDFPFWESNGIHTVYETHSWGGFVDEFLSKIKLHYEIDTWQEELAVDYNNRLMEYYFTSAFVGNKNDYLILDSIRREFPNSKIDLSNFNSYDNVYVNDDNPMHPSLVLFNTSDKQVTYKVAITTIPLDIVLPPNCWWRYEFDVENSTYDVVVTSYRTKPSIDIDGEFVTVEQTTKFVVDKEYVERNKNKRRIILTT